jgi:hypothetical protein
MALEQVGTFLERYCYYQENQPLRTVVTARGNQKSMVLLFAC